jgi:SPP1 family predicted phage head-tail adaptor
MTRYANNAGSTKRRKRVKDKRIIIYTTSYDEDAKVDIYYPVHPGKLWAYIRQLSGDEIYTSKQASREEDVLLVVNYRPDHKDWDIVLYNGTYCNITRVDTFEGYKGDLTIYASSIRHGLNSEHVREWNGCNDT